MKRNKTDAADAAALLEAARASNIQPVRIKSIERQALQGLHRTRSLWMSTRTRRINALRGFCQAFGLAIPPGARIGVEAMARLLADPGTAIPELIRGSMKLLIEEIRLLEQRIAHLEKTLSEWVRPSPACQELLSVPGIGLLTATAMVAATAGEVSHYRNARHFASWFGLTPKEHSSGSTRHLGRISKRGDRYLRLLLTHGARAVLRAALVAKQAGRPIDGLKEWALKVHTPRPRVRWRTSWRASAMPCCGIMNPTASSVCGRRTRRRTARRMPWRVEESNYHPAFAKRLITHHGSNDCLITD